MSRDGNGRFGPGNNFGKGRPRRVTEAQYLEATVGQVTLKDWRLIVDQAVKDAQTGDYRARSFLADYLIGKPPQIVDLRGQDALLLSEVLQRLSEKGLSPGETFNAMLALIADTENVEVEVEDDE